MTKILIVDDEEGIRNIIKEYAEYSGYEVFEATDGAQAQAMVATEEFDLVIMDLMMPNMDGFSAIKAIKLIRPKVPIIILSAKSNEYSKLFGFEIGADDYVTKPFSPKELMARITALLKRVGGYRRKECMVVREGFEIDQSAHEVRIYGSPIDLTTKEYELLVFFAEHKGEALSREVILQNVWGYSGVGYDRTVDTHVKMLRNSLGDFRDTIVTIRGMGYKFEA